MVLYSGYKQKCTYMYSEYIHAYIIILDTVHINIGTSYQITCVLIMYYFLFHGVCISDRATRFTTRFTGVFNPPILIPYTHRRTLFIVYVGRLGGGVAYPPVTWVTGMSRCGSACRCTESGA